MANKVVCIVMGDIKFVCLSVCLYVCLGGISSGTAEQTLPKILYRISVEFCKGMKTK